MTVNSYQRLAQSLKNESNKDYSNLDLNEKNPLSALEIYLDNWPINLAASHDKDCHYSLSLHRNMHGIKLIRIFNFDVTHKKLSYFPLKCK